jgi:hypothetical protein
MKTRQVPQDSKDRDLIFSIVIAVCFVGGGWFMYASRLESSSILSGPTLVYASHTWMSVEKRAP